MHGVDLVVGRDGGREGAALLAVVEDLAHALQVLVDAHAHQLDLDAQLVELLVEDRSEAGPERRPT